jgi:hypothetical protein
MTSHTFATYWANRLGAEETSLTQLGGGINNSVFSCCSDNGKWVIKAYPNENKDQQDRMNAEVDFLRYAAIAAPGCTPELIEIDKELRCIVMEYIPGDPYLTKVEAPSIDHLRFGASFIDRLNRDLSLSREMIQLDAAEGFSALSRHIVSIQERFSLMNTEHIPLQAKEEANRMYSLLEIQINDVETKLASQISTGSIRDSIRTRDKWVSPSDFGFHNAIYHSNNIIFIDFEFAGWDDPAKTILDFWMQPRIQVPDSWLDISLRVLPQHQKRDFLRRLNAAADIFELKWASIVLSILNPSRYNQMLSDSTEEERIVFVLARLKKASRYLGRRYSNEFKRVSKRLFEQ